MVTCHQCETEINQATEICPHCGADLTLPVPGAEPVKQKAKPTLAKILLRWAILLGVLLGAMWSFLWFVVTPRTGNVALQAETQAVQTLADVRAALAAYAATQDGVFPETLEPLGPPVRQTAQLAQSNGYQLVYMPGPPGADGAIHSYSLEARAGNYGYRNFYTDASGVVRATTENRPANSMDPPAH
jgi:hypothetical protein